jgi:hypothetical protein
MADNMYYRLQVTIFVNLLDIFYHPIFDFFPGKPSFSTAIGIISTNLLDVCQTV